MCTPHTAPHIRQFSLRYDSSCSWCREPPCFQGAAVSVSVKEQQELSLLHASILEDIWLILSKKTSVAQQVAESLVCRRSEKKISRSRKSNMDAGGGTAVSVTVQVSRFSFQGKLKKFTAWFLIFFRNQILEEEKRSPTSRINHHYYHFDDFLCSKAQWMKQNPLQQAWVPL